MCCLARTLERSESKNTQLRGQKNVEFNMALNMLTLSFPEFLLGAESEEGKFIVQFYP